MNTPMTPEQKIIAITEWEGIPTKKVWRVRYKDKSFHYESELYALKSVEFARHSFGLDKDEISKPEEVEVPSRLPPYLTSRDAICGAVARLDDDKKRVFSHMLRDIVFGIKPEAGISHIVDIRAEEITNMLLATAAQLADALLLTLGYEI